MGSIQDHHNTWTINDGSHCGRLHQKALCPTYESSRSPFTTLCCPQGLTGSSLLNTNARSYRGRAFSYIPSSSWNNLPFKIYIVFQLTQPNTHFTDTYKSRSTHRKRAQGTLAEYWISFEKLSILVFQ